MFVSVIHEMSVDGVASIAALFVVVSRGRTGFVQRTDIGNNKKHLGVGTALSCYGGFMLEVKAKVSPGTLDPSLYHKDHKMKITKRTQGLGHEQPYMG